MVREDANSPGRGCATSSLFLPALPTAPEPPRQPDCNGILDKRRGISGDFRFLSGDGRARGCHLVFLKAVPAEGTLVTRGFMAVSREQECEPDAAGLSVEVCLPSLFVFLLVV